ncbi:Fungal transcriptional regulatory protein [Cordyceps fumosorosea ARSEF 2679]|uniref:Fungal transcriptional regulatory protein n=1 Tax=Cordyceps fumosorosea (strain ARSEF 2679) TaxID=1081104 RepID=A0A168EK03_CORFA|nr:Fungal transcriptional regulatory protein [Cordyceps fumosorosea ARSEF 2679]OAA73907.1 Fungal transcriptional regulatory protein [Cordyceps fumosorosea ARSEF 2679]
MTRSKVLEDQRKRIGQACKGCQNRKQKTTPPPALQLQAPKQPQARETKASIDKARQCNGQNPCLGCEKRGHNCSYDPPRKRKSVTRLLKHDGTAPSPVGQSNPYALQGIIKSEPGNSPPLLSPMYLQHGQYDSPSAMSEWRSPSNPPDAQLDRFEQLAATRVPGQPGLPFWGSSSASFLTEIKKLVFQVSGPCPFTEGETTPSRLGSNSRSQGLQNTVPLPPREVAEHLVNRARQYSNHLVEILEESTIQELLQSSYPNAPSQDSQVPGSTCLLYLLFAAGSLSVESQKGTEYPDQGLFPPDSLRSSDEYFDYAEATLMRIGGYETFEVWMIQAWALMTTYSLAVSKWNAADAYIGLAVRAADVLGINHVPGSSSRAPSEVKANSALHAKLWRCLFVLDSLVAALLGRKPQALKEEKSKPTVGAECAPSSTTGRDDHLTFNVASAKMIRKTIKLVYNQRHFPAERASSMLQQTLGLLPPSASPQDGADALATEHAMLFRSYAAMLLTRPFFTQELYQASSQQKHDTTWKYLSTTCVATAHQAVERIFKAYNQSPEFRNDYIWRPCLYTAVLIILTNQFFGFHKYHTAGNVVDQAFSILKLWDARNPTEEAELNSLSALRCLVEEQAPRRSTPVYFEVVAPGPYGAPPVPVGYDVPGDGGIGGPVFPTHDFAVACVDSTTYCGPDGRRYSAAPASDYMGATAPIGGIAQLNAWGGVALPSMNMVRCATDAGCYSFAMQQDGYDGDAMQVTQQYAAYPGQQPYLS